MIDPDAALEFCRFLHFASLMLVWGASAYLAWLVPRSLAEDIVRRLGMAGALAIGVAIASVLAALPIETAFIGEGWKDALDPGLVRDVLLDTTVGWAWQLQAALACLLLLASVLPTRRRQGSIALLSGLLLASAGLGGHAVMQAGWLGAAHVANDMMHVLAGGAWLGAMVPLLLILRTRQRDYHADVSAALRRFSNAGHVAVALVIASGIANMLLILGHLPLEWSSPYQVLLCVKIAVVAVMTSAAIVNRYVLVPRIQRGDSRAVAAIRISTLLEILLGLGAIGAVSVFGMLEPV